MCNFEYGYQQYFKWNEALVQHYFARGQAMILLYVDEELLEEIGTRAGITCHAGRSFREDFYFSVERFCKSYTHYVHGGPLGNNHPPCKDYLSVANDIITYEERNRRVFIFYPQRIDYIGTRTEYGAPYTLPFFSIIIYMLLHFDGPNVERWQWDNLPDHVAPDWQSREYIQSLWNELHKYNNGFDKKASVFAPRNDNRQDHIGKVMYHLPLSPSSRRIIEDALYQSNSWQLKDRISFYEMAVRIQGSVADNYVTNEINDIIRGNPVKQRKLQAIIEGFDISEYLKKLQERRDGNAAAPANPKIQGEFVLCINIPDDEDPYIGLRTTINQAVDADGYQIKEGTDLTIAGLNRYPVKYNGVDRVDIGKYRIGRRRNGTLRIIKSECDDPIFFYEYDEYLYIQTEDTMMNRPYIVMVRDNNIDGFEQWCNGHGTIPNNADAELQQGWKLYYCNRGWDSQYYPQNVQADNANAVQSFELRGGMGDRRDRYYINALPYIKIPQQYIGRVDEIQLHFGVNGKLLGDESFTKTIVGDNIILDINAVNADVPYCDLTVEIDRQQTHFDFDLSVPTIHYEDENLLRYDRFGRRLGDDDDWANYGNYISDGYRIALPNQYVWGQIEGAREINTIDGTMYLVNLIADHCSVSKKFSISNEEFKRCVEYASRRLGLDLNQDDLVKKCKKVLVEAGIANYAEGGLQAIPPTFTKVPGSVIVGGQHLIMLSGCYNRKFMSDLLQFCEGTKVRVYAIANNQNHEDDFNRFIPPIVLIDGGFWIDEFREQYGHKFDRELDYDFALSLLKSAADLNVDTFHFAPGTQDGLEATEEQSIPRIRHDANPDYCKHWYIEKANNQLAPIDKSMLGWASLYCARERNNGENVFVWKSGRCVYISSKVTLPTPIKRALFLMTPGLPEDCKAFVCNKEDIGLYLKVRKYSLHTDDRLNLLITKVTGDNVDNPVHFIDRIQNGDVRIELWRLINRFQSNRPKNLLVFYDNNNPLAFGNLKEVYFNVRGTFRKVDVGINELFSFLIQNNRWQLNGNVIAVGQNDNQGRFVINGNAANRDFPNRDEYVIESLEIL